MRFGFTPRAKGRMDRKNSHFRQWFDGSLLSIQKYVRRNSVISDAGCWIWKLQKTKFGYGKFCCVLTNEQLAHRLSFIAFNGEIPTALNVCHKCDIPSCVNPDHLFLGTQQENMDDMVAKGRLIGKRGESAHLAKLKAEDVAEIRKLYHSNQSSSLLLSDRYGVCQSTIQKIVNGKLWSHLL